jgi:hypothetical protein
MLPPIRWLVAPFGFLHCDLNLTGDVFQAVVLGQTDPNQGHKVSKAVVGFADITSDQPRPSKNLRTNTAPSSLTSTNWSIAAGPASGSHARRL